MQELDLLCADLARGSERAAASTASATTGGLATHGPHRTCQPCDQSPCASGCLRSTGDLQGRQRRQRQERRKRSPCRCPACRPISCCDGERVGAPSRQRDRPDVTMQAVWFIWGSKGQPPIADGSEDPALQAASLRLKVPLLLKKESRGGRRAKDPSPSCN